ncbi:MAG: hypothetical protein GY851_22310 [bacterium]|nr:hypothetical protein [bacterium]
MKKKKNIIALLILLAVVGGFYAAYRYYIQELLSTYAKNEERLAQLEQKRKSLAMTFQDWRPELVLAAYERQIEPWRSEVDRWAEFFQVRGDDEANRPPEGEVPRFWYETVFMERYNDLQRHAFAKGVVIPRNTFGAEQPSALMSQDVSFFQVLNWLRAYQLGDVATRMLLDKNARQINTVEVWPSRKVMGIFKLQQYGFGFQMTLGDLAGLLGDLNEGDLENPSDGNRFHRVAGIRIANSQVMNPTPLLRVQMLVNDLEYVRQQPPAKPQDAQARMRALSGEGDGEGRRGGRFDREERTWWQNFRRKYLPF